MRYAVLLLLAFSSGCASISKSDLPWRDKSGSAAERDWHGSNPSASDQVGFFNGWFGGSKYYTPAPWDGG